MDLKEFLENQQSQFGFSHFGIAELSRPMSFDIYQQWLDENLHGDMGYLAAHSPIKETPQKQWPDAKTAIVFAMPYFPHPEKKSDFPIKQARLSLYSQGYDYHFWFRQKMRDLCDLLKTEHPNEEFICFTDSTPILERDLAYRAGLGWVGKNTCLIDPKKGSLFFIGEIITTLKITSEAKPVHDFCGNCTRCMDICPTQALITPKKMDARKCISYLTIESRKTPPLELREKMGDWLFGCDLCQTVCPWNQKAFKNQLSIETTQSLTSSQESNLVADLKYILTSSGKKLEKDFYGTPLARAGSFGLKRNALIIVANRKIKELELEVQALLENSKLQELVQWTLEKLLHT